MNTHEAFVGQRWLSIVEYARAFHISDMTIRRRIKTGKLSATLKDGKYYIPVSDEAFQKSQEAAAPTPPSAGPTSASPAAVVPPTVATSSTPPPPPSPLPASPSPLSSPHRLSSPDNASHAASSSTYVPPASTPPPGSAVAPSMVMSEALRHSTVASSSVANSQPMPSSIQSPAMPMEGKASVDVQQLFSTCDQFMQKISQQTQDLKEAYENKILYLEKSLMLKDSTIVQLHQKIEDLQLLVQIFEGKGQNASSHPSLSAPKVSL